MMNNLAKCIVTHKEKCQFLKNVVTSVSILYNFPSHDVFVLSAELIVTFVTNTFS